MRRRAFIATFLFSAIVANWHMGSVTIGNAATSQSSSPQCVNIQLLIRPAMGNGAAGHYAVMYRIHNLRNSGCSLLGFPGAGLLDAGFSTLPTHVIRTTNLFGPQPVRLVRLKPHGNAYFVLEWSTVPTGNEPCPDARYLMITAPNNTLPVVTYAAQGMSIHPCGGRLFTTPVEPKPLM